MRICTAENETYSAAVECQVRPLSSRPLLPLTPFADHF